jgi:hypothetical protein
VQERLRGFNDKIRVDLIVATDGKGRVIARVGADEGVYKDGLEGYPLVADALRGYRGDDTWSEGGKLFRVAASPVIARDRYAGALVIGQEVGAQLAQSMKQVLDLDVAFLLRGRVLAASAQLPALSRLPMLVDQQQVELARSGRTAPLPIDGDPPYLTVIAPFQGEASGHKAAYALLVPKPAGASLTSLVSGLVSTLDPKALPWRDLAPVAGGLLVAIVLGLVLLRAQGEGPLRKLSRDAMALARGELQRLDEAKHTGTLGAIARAVNTTLDRLGATIRAPLKSDPPTTTRPPLVGSGTGPAKVTLDLRAGGPLALDQEPLLSPPEDDASLEPAVGARPMSLVAAHDTTSQPTSMRDDGPDMVDAPAMPPLSKRDIGVTGPTSIRTPSPPPRGNIAAAAAAEEGNFGDDDPTVAGGASASKSELSSVSTGRFESPAKKSPTLPPTPPPLPKAVAEVAPEDSELDSELSQVYHDFIETKQRLGEPTDGVSLEKFLVKLKANRAQLMSRYSCKTVKFQVYVKDGKAALKATPVQS